MTSRQRLDKALVERDLARSRSHAKNLIEEDNVLVDGFPAQKAATLVEHNDHIEVEGEEYQWVGRGGKKIWPFLDQNWIRINNTVALDVGASTGGFTQALLRAGAKLVHAVDVGYGQLNYQLQQDDRVNVMDRYNFRYADPSDFSPAPKRFTMDVSFISTLKLIDALNKVVEKDSEGLALIKPQFEAGPGQTEEGIMKDPTIIKNTLNDVLSGWLRHGWGVRRMAPAQLTGAEGNQEFVVNFVQNIEQLPPERAITKLVDSGNTWNSDG